MAVRWPQLASPKTIYTDQINGEKTILRIKRNM
jgi:hypothetical protein